MPKIEISINFRDLVSGNEDNEDLAKVKDLEAKQKDTMVKLLAAQAREQEQKKEAARRASVSGKLKDMSISAKSRLGLGKRPKAPNEEEIMANLTSQARAQVNATLTTSEVVIPRTEFETNQLGPLNAKMVEKLLVLMLNNKNLFVKQKGNLIEFTFGSNIHASKVVKNQAGETRVINKASEIREGETIVSDHRETEVITVNPSSKTSASLEDVLIKALKTNAHLPVYINFVGKMNPRQAKEMWNLIVALEKYTADKRYKSTAEETPVHENINISLGEKPNMLLGANVAHLKELLQKIVLADNLKKKESKKLNEHLPFYDADLPEPISHKETQVKEVKAKAKKERKEEKARLTSAKNYFASATNDTNNVSILSDRLHLTANVDGSVSLVSSILNQTFGQDPKTNKYPVTEIYIKGNDSWTQVQGSELSKIDPLTILGVVYQQEDGSDVELIRKASGWEYRDASAQEQHSEVVHPNEIHLTDSLRLVGDNDSVTLVSGNEKYQVNFVYLIDEEEWVGAKGLDLRNIALDSIDAISYMKGDVQVELARNEDGAWENPDNSAHQDFKV